MHGRAIMTTILLKDVIHHLIEFYKRRQIMNKLIELIENGNHSLRKSLETSIFVLFVMDLSLVCQSSFSHLSLSLLPMSQMLWGFYWSKDVRPS